MTRADLAGDSVPAPTPAPAATSASAEYPGEVTDTPLKGIRKVIAERLGAEGECDRHCDRHVLALCDLDFFKQANDTYGHQFGDRFFSCSGFNRLLHATAGMAFQ